MSVVEKKFESYFRDRITFSNVDSRTSRRIYRLALLLRAPETISSLSKSRISIFNAPASDTFRYYMYYTNEETQTAHRVVEVFLYQPQTQPMYTSAQSWQHSCISYTDQLHVALSCEVLCVKVWLMVWKYSPM